MNSTDKNFKPCDGNVPEGWEMPELGSRIKYNETFISIDFRGLSAPTPLVGTLKALEQLPAHMHFEGYYPHAPVHLFPILMEENWKWTVIRENEDGALLKIYKDGTE